MSIRGLEAMPSHWYARELWIERRHLAMNALASTVILGVSLIASSLSSAQTPPSTTQSKSESPVKGCSELRQRVLSITAKQLGVPIRTLTNESRFVADVGADSLNLCELTMAIEDEFGIEIPDEAAENLTTIQQYLNYLSRRLACRPTPKASPSATRPGPR